MGQDESLEERIDGWEEFANDVGSNIGMRSLMREIGMRSLMRELKPHLNESQISYLYQIWKRIKENKKPENILIDNNTASEVDEAFSGAMGTFDGSPYVSSRFGGLDLGFYFLIKYLRDSAEFKRESVDINLKLVEELLITGPIEDVLSLHPDEVIREKLYRDKIGDDLRLKKLQINPFDSSLDRIIELINIISCQDGDNLKIIDKVIESIKYFPGETIRKVLESFIGEDFFNESRLKTIERLIDKYRDVYDQTNFPVLGDYLYKLIDNPTASAEAIEQLVDFKHPDYELIKVIGSGANKNVFLARDRTYHDEDVVVKLFGLRDVEEYMRVRDGAVTDFDFLSHEKRAARVSIRSRNPNINVVSFVHRLDDDLYMMVEERFDRTLENLVEERKRELGIGIRVEDVLFYTLQILNGLKDFHRSGLCHGDLKAANIGLLEHEIKLTDCGYATSFYYDRDKKTICFRGLSIRAPELYSEKGGLVKQTPQSDMWAIGVLIYYIITGEYPFYRGNDEEKVRDFKAYERKVYEDIKIKLEDPKKLFRRFEFRGGLGRYIVPYIQDCLQFDPNKRPRNAQNFAIDLEFALAIPEENNSDVVNLVSDYMKTDSVQADRPVELYNRKYRKRAKDLSHISYRKFKSIKLPGGRERILLGFREYFDNDIPF